MARTAVVAGTATAVSNRVSRRQAGRWAAQEQQQQQYSPP
ncbi:MAG TPA: SHOCT domain-containing protein, partial [Intrasporangium sp.]